jgi:hypothetical protein
MYHPHHTSPPYIFTKSERKSGYYKKPTPPPEIEEVLRTKYVDQSLLEQLEKEKRDAEFNKLFEIEPYEPSTYESHKESET